MRRCASGNVDVRSVPIGGTLGGACECGVGTGDGATEAGDARNGPTLLLLVLRAECSCWWDDGVVVVAADPFNAA